MTTLLDEALSPANLRLAWDEVANNQGVPGVDDVSIRAWRRNWEERLVRLARDVRSGRYQPKKLRIRRIPKPQTGQFRTLRIPTVTDRVLQRAVLEVLYPVFEALFLDCCFGYRPGLGLYDAVERILVLRENGYRHVLDADIDDFFNQVDLALLLSFLVADLPDDSLLPLLEAWLSIGGTANRGSQSDVHKNLQPSTFNVQPLSSDNLQSPIAGIPLGSPLSPLLANCLLHRLDLAVRQAGFHMVRYADDFLVLCESRSQAEAAYHLVEKTLETLHLRYEPSKTRLTSFEEGFTFLGVDFQGDTYEYTWENKRIQVSDDEPDWLFRTYGPKYGG